MSEKRGKVYLCGVGPGDPDLVTVRARALLERADVVVTDALAPELLLAYVRADAEIVRAGKRAGNHPEMAQDEINRLLVEKARAGLEVVRMKGGDPFVFGRGGEEAEVLASEGVDFEVVPGVSSAVAVAAYAGIPVTHRGVAKSFAVVTGHARKEPSTSTSTTAGSAAIELPSADTLVFLMGMTLLEENLRRLVEQGRDADTPAAIIQWGTTPRQRVVVATLGTLAARARADGMTPPSVVVVGEVVRLREKLSWFERLPLFGKRVLVTRAAGQASALGDRLLRLGAEPVYLATIEIAPPSSFAPLDRALDELASCTHVVFTSANGVDAFFARLYERGFDARRLGAAQLAVIGPATAKALHAHGLRADLVAKEFRAESLADSLIAGGLIGARILLARAAVAREVLVDTLREAGATVDVVPVYETHVPAKTAALAAKLLDEKTAGGGLDVLTFTSASTVDHFCDALGDDDARRLCEGAVVACIGPITRDAALARGLRCDVMPAEYTIPALCDALAAHFASATDTTPIIKS